MGLRLQLNGAYVQAEIIPSTSETLPEDKLNTLTDTRVRAIAEAWQTREFQRHYPEKSHGGTNLEVADR
ncbi:hypothetical protein Syun_015007 [Stephania yunnanensis]|uniref:Uncharacterized protein n=1 Tax=Stephania yunnanensis TaxID=152371 RepID=A0AAP0JMP2_9MAGN